MARMVKILKRVTHATQHRCNSNCKGLSRLSQSPATHFNNIRDISHISSLSLPVSTTVFIQILTGLKIQKYPLQLFITGCHIEQQERIQSS